MKTETTKITWANGWQHTKTVERFDCGQVVTTIISKHPDCLFTFDQMQDVWSNGRTTVERVVLTPSGRVQEKLSSGKMSLAERCKAMMEMSDWIKVQNRQEAA